MPAFEAQPGMPYWQDLGTNQPLKSTRFYSGLLGWEISDEAYRIARKEGLPVAGFLPDMPDMWLTYFLGGDGEEVERLGGKVLSSAELTLGTMTICEDPVGGLFGLLDPAGEDQFVAAGEPGVPVWYEYLCEDASAIDFYGELFDWEIREEDGYYVALADGAPFLGMRVGPKAGGVWFSYFGVEDIEAACRKAFELGGNVDMGPSISNFGPLAGIRDANGAPLFLVEVPKPTFEEINEADSVL